MASTAFRHDLHVVTAAGQLPLAVVRLHGDVDCSAADDVRRVLEKVSAPDRVATVVVDLEGVTFINCVGLSPLLMAKRRLGEKLELRAVPPCVRRLLTLTHLTTWMASSCEQPEGAIQHARPWGQGDSRPAEPATRDAFEAGSVHPPAQTRRIQLVDTVPTEAQPQDDDGRDRAAAGNPGRRGRREWLGPASG